MTGRKGRSGGARKGSGRPFNFDKLAAANPALAMDYIDALYRAAKRGRVSAMIEFLRLGMRKRSADR